MGPSHQVQLLRPLHRAQLGHMHLCNPRQTFERLYERSVRCSRELAAARLSTCQLSALAGRLGRSDLVTRNGG